MEPGRKRARSDASHGVFSEQTCSRAHFRSKKWGSRVLHFKRLFVRLTRPACADINAFPFRHNTHFARATCSRARTQTVPKHMPFGKHHPPAFKEIFLIGVVCRTLSAEQTLLVQGKEHTPHATRRWEAKTDKNSASFHELIIVPHQNGQEPG